MNNGEQKPAVETQGDKTTGQSSQKSTSEVKKNT
jgi:hypothetical protein